MKKAAMDVRKLIKIKNLWRGRRWTASFGCSRMRPSLLLIDPPLPLSFSLHDRMELRNREKRKRRSWTLSKIHMGSARTLPW